MEFTGCLAALVPKPRVNLTRFHGVFSPNSKLREYVVPIRPANEAQDWQTDEMFDKQGEIIMPVFGNEDAIEGAQAFAEKRPPVWKGK